MKDPKVELEELEREKNSINEELVQLMLQSNDQLNKDRIGSLSARR